MFYADDEPSPISPWVGLLGSQDGRTTAWRNLKIQGEPKLPREVKLSQGDRLEGWVTAFYNESQPARRTEQQTDQYGNIRQVISTGTVVRVRTIGTTAKADSKSPRPPVKLDDFDWAALDGVIHGRRMFPDVSVPNPNVVFNNRPNSGTEADQSRLYYFRPLRDGDSITYEFFYEPGQVMVHPAIDRLAFLLEDGGVRVHWMTAAGNDLSGLPADNAADEPANRRGPKPIPLKAGQWNAVKLSLDASKVTLDLNGQTIYERPLESSLGRQFGLFHYKDQTAAQARNIVLRGHWPDKVTKEQLGNLLALDAASPQTDSIRRARHAVIGESLFAFKAGEIVEKAEKLPPGERYTVLADWVLPTSDHPVWRLEGEFTPTFPPPSAVKNGGAGARRGVRLQSGGELRAPAIELVETAKAIGKLDELVNRIDGIKRETDSGRVANERGKVSLQALVQIARGDDSQAAKAIETIQKLLDQRPFDQPEWTRWPELVLATRAIERPSLRTPAQTLLETMAGLFDKKPGNPDEPRAATGLWEQRIDHLRARATVLAQAEKGGPVAALAFGTDPGDTPWARVTPTQAESRGRGEPIPHWSHRDGELTHYPGHVRDLLYLNVPLRGEFQLDCELTSSPRREIQVVYGGLAVAPKADLKHLERSQFGRPLSEIAINPPLDKLAEWYPYRVVVKGGRTTSFINGRKVIETPVATDVDPWLALVCLGSHTGAARKVTISGNPTFPAKLNLSSLPELAGFTVEDYAETTTGENPDWDKRGDEIVGRSIEGAAGSKQESLLRYHRPMVEDGRIAYEFYYEPGKVMVHPALDRLAFLLEPEGVKIHVLTDGAYERNGLAGGNTRDEPENRRGPASVPLKPNAWNSLVLSLAGDKATLELNGQAIYERSLEPTNQRTFGLFHFADETQVRVRSISYQGHWPRRLPESIQ